MDFDWSHLPSEWDSSLNPRDIEESFEDPFAIRLLPDASRFSAQARYFNLGKSASGMGLFSVFRTNGRQMQVICSRAFTPEEQFFYQRRVDRSLSV